LHFAKRGIGCWVAAALAALPGGALAQTPELTLELNTLEPRGESCGVNMVFINAGGAAYDGFKLDLVAFGPDGAIVKRLAVEAAPLRANKTTVKTFVIDGLACDAIDSLLLNDVLECRTAAGAVADCVDRVDARTRLPVAFFR
jgi:hypothetical protein